MHEFYEKLIKPTAKELDSLLDVTIPYVQIPNSSEDFWSAPALARHDHTESRIVGHQLFCADCDEELINLRAEAEREFDESL